VQYRIVRQAGAAYSSYFVPEDFSPEDFEGFVDCIHDTMALDSAAILELVRYELGKVNSSSGIEVDGTYLSQLLDYARLRLRTLRDGGHLDGLMTPNFAGERDPMVLAAFELGFAASELRLLEYEDALVEGVCLQEGREVGRAAAARAKAEQTRRTRTAILRAASSAYAADPDLMRNDAATARRIAAMKLKELCRHGQSIGQEAIVKHLRSLRQQGTLHPQMIEAPRRGMS
jgi:hypothetical protein